MILTAPHHGDWRALVYAKHQGVAQRPGLKLFAFSVSMDLGLLRDREALGPRAHPSQTQLAAPGEESQHEGRHGPGAGSMEDLL